MMRRKRHCLFPPSLDFQLYPSLARQSSGSRSSARLSSSRHPLSLVLFNFSAAELFNISAAELFSFSAAELFDFSAAELFDSFVHVAGCVRRCDGHDR
jgi:hypothetical protein